MDNTQRLLKARPTEPSFRQSSEFRSGHLIFPSSAQTTLFEWPRCLLVLKGEQAFCGLPCVRLSSASKQGFGLVYHQYTALRLPSEMMTSRLH